MDCQRARERLSEYIDSMLDRDVAARLEEHLAACPECAKELEELRRVVAGMAALGKLEAPEGLYNGVMRRVEHAAQGGAPSRRRLRWIYAAAAAVLFFAGAAAVFYVIEDERAESQLVADLEQGDLDRAGRVGAETGARESADEYLGREPRAASRGRGAEALAAKGRGDGLDRLGKLPSGTAAPERMGERGYAEAEIAEGRPEVAKDIEDLPAESASAEPIAGEMISASALPADYNLLVVETPRGWAEEAAALGARPVPSEERDEIAGEPVASAETAERAGAAEDGAPSAPRTALYEVDAADLDALVRRLAASGAEAVYAYAVGGGESAFGDVFRVAGAEPAKAEAAKAPVALWKRGAVGDSRLRHELGGGAPPAAAPEDVMGIVRTALERIERNQAEAPPGEVVETTEGRRKAAAPEPRDDAARKLLILFVKGDSARPAGSGR